MFSVQNTAGNPPASVLRKLGGSDEHYNRVSMLLPVSQWIKDKEFYIKSNLESLDYGALTSQIELETVKANTQTTVKMYSILRIGLFILTGTLVALIGVVLELAADFFGYLKYTVFETPALEQFDGTFKTYYVFIIYRLIGVIVPVMIGAGLVVFLAPYAAGGDLAQSIAYLNGVNVPNVLSMRGLIVKALSTTCVVVSGLSGGKEGPMMNMGANTGGRLPSAFPCLVFKVEKERRYLAAAGFGCGLACVFGAPVGGLLMALEEGVCFLELSIMFKIYLCCVVGSALGTIVMSLLHRGTVDSKNTELLTMGYIHPDVTEYNLFELLFFGIIAVIGGLIGALVTLISIEVVKFRNKYMKTNKRKMTATFIAALVVTFFQTGGIWFLRTCSPIPPDETFFSENSTTFRSCPYRLYCPKGKRSDMAVLFSKTQGNILRIFFSRDIVHMTSLGIFCLIYFILLIITMGTPISAGIFIPQIIMGATWGRLFGTFLQKMSDNAEWAKPAKYAYLGAAAQLSGTTGKTFSILIIFVEACENVQLSLPLMVIVIITRIVSTFFITPFYVTQMRVAGYPFLSHKPPPVDCDVPTSEIMSKPPLVTLPPSPTVRTIISTLRGNTHNGFPIVKTKPEADVETNPEEDVVTKPEDVETKPEGHSTTSLVGLILRQQLLILLKYKSYLYPPPTTNKQMCECYHTFMKESRTKLDEEKIFEGVAAEHYTIQIDLSPYYSLYPKCVTFDVPIIEAYEYFRVSGVRHVVVITSNREPVGMITRKDLAKFRTVESYCREEVKEMEVK